MGRKTAIIVAVAAVAAALAAIYFLVPREPEPAPGPAPRAAPPEGFEKALVHLYFGTPGDTTLVPEARMVALKKDPAALGREVVNELLAGPRKEGIRVIPEGTRLNALFVTGDQTCYLDLSREVVEGQPGGSAAELLTVWSLVNSLVLNVDGIRSVRILVDGRGRETLAGHVALNRAFQADMRLIR